MKRVYPMKPERTKKDRLRADILLIAALLALALGFEEDSPPRIAAALIFEMVHNLNNGHSFLPREKLVAATAQLIGVEAEAAEECLDVLADEGEIVQEFQKGFKMGDRVIRFSMVQVAN